MKLSHLCRGLCLIFVLILSASCSPSPTPLPNNSSALEQNDLGLQTSTPRPTATAPRDRTPFPTEVIIRGTVSIRHAWNETQLPVLVQIIKNFQTLYPNVLFDVLYVPADNLHARYIQDTQDGLGPTLLLGPAEWGPELWQLGLVADLAPLVSDNLLATLNQPALQSARSGNQLVGLPCSLQGVVLYRNKDIITLPPGSFEELVTLAQIATQGDILGAFLERSFFYSGGHLAGLGGQLMDDNGAPAFNDEAGLAWMELLKKLEEAGATDFYTDADLERFKQGKVGWIIDGTWNLHNLADALGSEKLAIDPWPRYAGGRLAGFVTAENLYLSTKAQGDDLNASRRFMEYLLSSEAQSLLTDAEQIPAALMAAPNDSKYGELTIQVISALSTGVSYSINPAIAAYSTNLDISLRSYFDRQASAEQALQSAQAAIQAVLAQNSARATPNP